MRDKRISDNLSYINSTIEDYNREGVYNDRYDIVTSFEVIEHVDNPSQYIDDMYKCIKPGGLLFISTMEKSVSSYIYTILLAEKVLKIVDDGIHDHDKYINLIDMIQMCERVGLDCLGSNYTFYNPVSNTFFYTNHIHSNYIVCFRKPI